MSEAEWAGIADRLDLVWEGELTEDRRRLYFGALSDLEASQVDRAVGDLIRQGRDHVAPPKVIRRLALGAPLPAPFNGLALAGLLLPLFALLAWAGTAAASEDDAGPIPIRFLVVAIIGFLLASAALDRARKGVRRGRGLSWAALAMGSIAVVFGLLSFGQGINESDQEGRGLAPASGSASVPLSDADDERLVGFSLAATDWFDANTRILDRFEDAPPDDVWNAERWIRSTPERIAAMGTADERMRDVIASISDDGLQRILAELRESYVRRTSLVARLHVSVAAGDADRAAILHRMVEAAANHDRLVDRITEAYPLPPVT